MEAHFTEPQITGREKHDVRETRIYPVRDRIKHELIVLIYRVTAMLIGTTLIIIGYLLFTHMVLAAGNLADYVMDWPRVGPPAGFVAVGLIFCIAGILGLMPLPELGNVEQEFVEFGDDAHDGIPVLAPLGVPRKEDKLWRNNVKPLIEKVANKESITSSERALLKNWLRTN